MKILELSIAAGFVVLAICLVNPFHFWMPNNVHMMVLAAFVVVMGILYVFVVRERAEDERDEAHAMFAGRIAFFAGSATLLAGIIVQTFAHTLDAWLVAALVAMVLAKIGARYYSALYR
jgi:hypothetical protein